jgi:hypothetical protein
MITNATPDVVKRKSIRLPNLSEVGHLVQGCGIGIIIGHTFDIVHLGVTTVAVIFFCLVVVGGYMINSSKR